MTILDQERMQLPCWIPVFIAIGILIGFQIEPVNYWVLITVIVFFLLLRLFCASLTLSFIITSFICIIIGLISIQIRVLNVNSPIIPFDEQFAYVSGKIDNITPIEHGYRILLSDVRIKKLSQEQTKMRLTVRTQINDARVGDIVKFSAILSRPMLPYLENSYNFARDAYFKQIGAVGYSVSDLKVIKTDPKSWQDKINSLRNNIQIRVNDAIGSYNGSIATALMINEYSNINKQVLKNLRATGLAHILSVSGMHLSLVAAIFFFSSRFLLNCFEPIALRIHCKKVAAFISLLGSFGYLLISGMEVAAIRSFIMTSMIIIAVIIDRSASPMRAIALAASVILIVTPENIIHPSFQMSFGAVLALIACYELFAKIKFDFASFNLFQKILFYLFSLSFASLIAGLATMPFILYHFNQSSNYSILANLLAIPIASFWLMPCVVLTFFLYPFHLEFLSLKIMEYGIELMLNIAAYVAYLPYSVTIFSKITDLNLLIIVFGMLWFCLWRTYIRLAGIFIICFAVILQSLEAKPDIFIDWDAKKIAILDQRNQLIFLTKPLAKFKKQLLMNQLGATVSFRHLERQSKEISCKENICLLHKDNYRVKFDLEVLTVEITKNGIIKQNLSNNKGTSLIYLK